ncbi:unnamed protein product [Sphacelaria rigidula]
MSVLHRKIPVLLLLVAPYVKLLLLQWCCLPHSASAFVLEPTYPNTNRLPRYYRRESAAIGPIRSRPLTGVGALRAALDIAPAALECGSVLWASPENYAHSTHQSVVLVYEHGEGLQTKGVIVDKGLEFTIGEMSSVDLGPLANNRLFRGGEDGGSAAIMIHARRLPQARALGDSGLFVGGFQSALGLVGAGQAQADEFKFFFNYMTWPEGAIEDQVSKGMWKVMKLPHDVVLDVRRTADMELWGRVERVMKKEAEQ